LEEKKT
jgi:hypothetical protein